VSVEQLEQRQEPYKALTYVNNPSNDDPPWKPGDMIDPADLISAGQTDENINDLLACGAIEEDDEVHPDHRPPDPTAPSLARVVEDAKRLVAELERKGEEVPGDLQAVAGLDYTHVVSGDNGGGDDKTS
jgi:hypothetical protein